MSPTFDIQLSRLREIGWDLWNPIGLDKGSWPNDEYDSYLLQVVGRLRLHAPVKEVAEYLVTVESDYMGLGSVPSAATRASATVEAIRAYLETLPDGPLRIRNS